MARRTRAETQALKDQLVVVNYKINHLEQNAPRELVPGTGNTRLAAAYAQQLSALLDEEKLLLDILHRKGK